MGFFVPDRLRLAIGVLAEPSVLTELRLVVAKGISAWVTGSRCVFPFGLGEQAIGLACLFCEPRQVNFRFIPGDIGYRAIISAPTTVRGVRAAARRHAGVPFCEGYSGLADREWLADRDLVLRSFIVTALFARSPVSPS